MKTYSVETELGGRTLKIETGKMAKLAAGSALVTYGDTVVLCTVVSADPQEGIDFFPLTVDYREKMYAAGKFPGGFFKREARPTQKEILTMRLTDRPIRPLFPEGFRDEVLIQCMVLSTDLENDPDVLCMCGASAALVVSHIPFEGPTAGVRVGRVDGEFVINPTIEQRAASDMEIILAGHAEAANMIEAAAMEVSEEDIAAGIEFGFRECKRIVALIKQLGERVGVEKRWSPPKRDPSLSDRVGRLCERHDLAGAKRTDGKAARYEAIKAVYDKIITELAPEGAEGLAYTKGDVRTEIQMVEERLMARMILDDNRRPDGRGPDDIREITCEVGILPRTHGSALFTRGETQALVVTTLGTGEDEQIIDALEGEWRQHFLLHYNFPPYSVGEAGRFGFTGRREIGHGKLAWRATRAVLPDRESFPYTIRIVSEITESNGSSSMATVCGASLSMMDAGVPLLRPVAGIAMGLILEQERFAILSDILGDEDHLGDMDFKVAGTRDGVTALQMDIKVAGITEAIMRDALAQAQEGRMHILDEMGKALGESRHELRESAPRIHAMKVPVDKIREVIGTGGKVIREITEKTGTKINIEDDGSIRIASPNLENIEKAVEWITGIVAEPEVGKVYRGKVVKVVDFGAFVNFLGTRDGLCHISELAPRRVKQVTDVVNEGDMVYVKCLGVDDRGKVRLSMKSVDQETGVEMPREPRSEDAEAQAGAE
jgi:polyribonucleotide nucleotidyltransferase